MSDSITKPSEADADLLAPPPFGIAETTGDQLLPIAMSMEHMLNEGLEPEPEPEPEPVDEPPPEPAPKVVAAPTTVAFAEEDAPADSNVGKFVAVAVVLLAIGGFFWVSRGGDASGGPEQVAANGASTPDAEPRAEAPVPSSTRDQAEPATAALPRDLDALRKLPFEERHTGLARASGDVPIELHIGLDLIQAEQSDEPCRTFSDALSIIESSEDPTTFKWAVDEATAPAGESKSCKGLTGRLAAAQGAGTPDDAPKPQPASRSSKGKGRSKPRPPRPKPAEDTAPRADDPPAKTTPVAPKPPPERASSVATKLDDDLRGLGE